MLINARRRLDLVILHIERCRSCTETAPSLSGHRISLLFHSLIFGERRILRPVHTIMNHWLNSNAFSQQIHLVVLGHIPSQSTLCNLAYFAA